MVETKYVIDSCNVAKYFKDSNITSNPFSLSEIKPGNNYEIQVKPAKPALSVAEVLGNMIIEEATKSAEKLFNSEGAKLSPESKKWLRNTVEDLYRRSLEEHGLA
jgi:hypothetical protein